MTNFLLVKDSRIEKINSCKSIKYSYTVAPHVGVWIETLITLCRTQERPVAPHVGAWIETIRVASTPLTPTSRPSRRGVDGNDFPLPLSKEIARVGDYTCSRTNQASRVRAVNPTELKLYQNYAITSHILVEWGIRYDSHSLVVYMMGLIS